MATSTEKILKELANMEARMNAKFATKEDLDLIREDLKMYATKIDLHSLKNDLMNKLDSISRTFQDTDEMLIILGARSNEQATEVHKIKQKIGIK